MDRLSDHRALLQLNEIILRACDPRPEQRYRDGAALLADLLTLQAGRPVRRTLLRMRVALIGAAAALTLALGGWWLWPVGTKPAARSPPGTPPAAHPVAAPRLGEKSLVVLPLENLSPDPENAYFTDGMHAEIIATLSRLSDLAVISRENAIRTFPNEASNHNRAALALEYMGRSDEAIAAMRRSIEVLPASNRVFDR